MNAEFYFRYHLLVSEIVIFTLNIAHFLYGSIWRFR